MGCSAGARARQIGLLYAQFSFYRPLAPRSTVDARQTALVPQRPAWRRQTLDETPVLVCPLTCSHYVTLPRASPSCPRLGLGPGTWERREAIERPSAALCTELRGCAAHRSHLRILYEILGTCAQPHAMHAVPAQPHGAAGINRTMYVEDASLSGGFAYRDRVRLRKYIHVYIRFI